MRCWTPLDDTAPQLNATVSSATTHRFLESDGVVDNTIYLCAVHFIFGLNNYTAASDPVSFKSLLDTSKFSVAIMIHYRYARKWRGKPCSYHRAIFKLSALILM